MTLEQLRAQQHDDTVTEADHALAAFLGACSIELARLDLEPTTAVELRHLARVRGRN